MVNSAQVLMNLSRFKGAKNGITASRLAHLCGCSERDLRQAIFDLRNDGHHICGHPSTGYFMANTDEELDATCAFLYGRAMSSLTQISAMKGIALPDLRGQLKLPT